MKKLRILLLSLIIISSTIIFSFRTYAHWIYATHEYLIDPLAINALTRDGKTKYVELLKTKVIVRGKEKTYLDLIIQGVRDADLRLNGIYAVDGHCKDPAKGPKCPEEEKVYNDIQEWIIGDHGYNPENNKGFYSNPEDNFLDERMNELLKNFYDPKTERLKQALGCGKEDRVCFINKLQKIAQESNATIMAKFFWERALDEWKKCHPGDAMYNLGIAIHLVQDATVPHHTRLIRDETHKYYEKYVWENYLKRGNFEPEIKVVYERLDAKEWVKRNAKESYRFNLSSLEVSAADSVKLAVNSTVGIITNFFDMVQVVKTEEKIFYIKEGDLWSMNLDGSGKERLTINEKVREFKSSPDNSKIAFRSRQGIFIINSYGNNKINLAHNAIAFTWSPYEEILRLIQSIQKKSEDTHTIKTYIFHEFNSSYDLISKDIRLRSNLTYADLSPDGNNILFVTCAGGGYWTHNIYLMNLATKTTSKIGSAFGAVGTVEPLWSPNGKKILFSSIGNERTTNGIFIYNINSRELLNIDESGIEPVWSPDGNRILYSASEGICIINSDGSEKKVIVTPPPVIKVTEPWCSGRVQDRLPQWSLDGSKIIFNRYYDIPECQGEVGLHSPEIWIVDANGSDLKKLTEKGCYLGYANWGD